METGHGAPTLEGDFGVVEAFWQAHAPVEGDLFGRGYREDVVLGSAA